MERNNWEPCSRCSQIAATLRDVPEHVEQALARGTTAEDLVDDLKKQVVAVLHLFRSSALA